MIISYCAIVHLKNDSTIESVSNFKKFNLQKGKKAMQSFVSFVKNEFINADHINIYDKKTRVFIEQIKL